MVSQMQPNKLVILSQRSCNKITEIHRVVPSLVQGGHALGQVLRSFLRLRHVRIDFTRTLLNTIRRQEACVWVTLK